MQAMTLLCSISPLGILLAITANAAPAILDVRDIDTPGMDSVLHIGGLTDGVSGFVDRDGQDWTGIPAILEGTDYIESAQDNADVSDDRGTTLEIEVDVTEGTILYMFIHDFQPSIPFPWMNLSDFGADWVDTGLDTTWTFDDSVFSIWRTATPLAAGTYTFRQMPTDSSFYGIAGTRTDAISVLTDIKPGSDLNPVNCKSKGVIPVAVFGSGGFDAATIDVATVTFGPGMASAAHNGHFEDANGDGFTDAIFHFHARDTDLNVRDVSAMIMGATSHGLNFVGTDSVMPKHCGTLVASFYDDMQGGGLPHGSQYSAGAWIYGWNSVGAIGDPMGMFSWLLPTDSDVFLYDTDGLAGLPDDPPGSFAYMGWVDTEQTSAGGHPGQGFEQNDHERFVMALFVLPYEGNFEIQRSRISLANSSGTPANSDGLTYFVSVFGEPPKAVGLVNPGYLNSASFDVELGHQPAGAFIVVGVGSRGNDNFDTFSLHFDIAAVPEH